MKEYSLVLITEQHQYLEYEGTIPELLKILLRFPKPRIWQIWDWTGMRYIGGM